MSSHNATGHESFPATDDTRWDAEPTPADLAAIDHEWPLIEAEVAVLDAEIAILTAAQPSELDWRRLRRAEARVLREAAALADRTRSTPLREVA